MQQTASVMCARAASCSRAVPYIWQCWVEAHAILHDTCYMNADSLSPCAIQSSGFMLSEGAEPALYLHIHVQLDMQLDLPCTAVLLLVTCIAIATSMQVCPIQMCKGLHISPWIAA